MAIQEFQFKFMVVPVKATIDEAHLTVKQGVRTFKAEIARLKHLYVLSHPNTGLECIISYETPEGKTKRMRVVGNFGEQQFSELVEALVKLKPGIDIRKMPLKEAHKLMGATNLVVVAPVIVFVVGILVVGVIFLPGLVHGFDFGQQELDITKCRATCPSATRNIILTNGYLNIEHYVEETTTTTNRGSTSETVRYYIPYAALEWQKGDPIYIVVETPQISEQELDALAEKDTLQGLLRNVLWEGLPGDTKKYFETDLNLNLAPEVRLVEYGADPRFDLILPFIIMGGFAIIMLIVTIILRRQYR
jgi:hypothetical protein